MNIYFSVAAMTNFVIAKCRCATTYLLDASKQLI